MKNITSLLLLCTLYSCNAQEQEFVDLEKVTPKFKVSKFYEKKLQSTNETLATDPKKLDKDTALSLLDNPFFAKDTLGYYETDGRFPTKLSLEASSDWMSRNKKPTEIFGYEYKTVAYNAEKDTLAILNKVAFPVVNMAEDKSGNLVYLETRKTAENPEDFKKVKDYLQANCKKVNIKNNEQRYSYWENENFFYFLTENNHEEEKILSYDLKGNKEAKMIKVTDIYLVMYAKDYIEKMEKLNIYSPGNTFWKKTP